MPFFKDKTVVVAGGSGLAGTAIVRALHAAGAQVKATYHNRPIPEVLDGVVYHQCDLTNLDQCKDVVKDWQYVVDAAAVVGNAKITVDNVLSLVNPNIRMGINMLEASYNAGVEKFLYFGSSTAYPDVDHPVREEEMFSGDPYDKYFEMGWYKRYIEKQCETYSRLPRPMTTMVLRLANLYGPNDDFNLDTCHALPALLRKIVEHQDPLQIWGDGKEIRDFTYVDDVADATLLALEKINTFEQINIGQGQGVSINEFIDILLKLENFNPYKCYDTAQPTMIPKRLINNTKAKELLVFTPKIQIEEGLDLTLTWFKQNKDRLRKEGRI